MRLNRLLIFILLLAGEISGLFSLCAFSLQKTDGDVLYKDVVGVAITDKTVRNKFLVSFHSEILEVEEDRVFLTLNQRQAERLLKDGFRLKKEDGWAKRWEAKQTEFLKKISNKSATGISGYECYATVEETFSIAQQLAEDNPNLVEWLDIGDSWEKTVGAGGYDIMLIKLTNQQIVTNKPILFIQSAIHAREYTTAALTLDFAKELVEDYAKKADTQWILDHHEVHIVFHANPDGRKKAEGGLLWRKNTNTAYCGINSNNRGADLNRNFTLGWGETANGSSSNQCDATYRGASAASEPEVATIEDYLRNIYPDRRGPNDSDASPDDIQGIHLDIHSFSELILWPWGHTETFAPNREPLERLGRRLAFWNQYAPMQSVGLYPTDGTSESISYGELGVPQFTFELGNSFFEPCTNYLQTIKPDNLPALYYAAKSVAAPFKLPFGPDIISLELNNAINANVDTGVSVNITGIAEDGRFNAVGSNADKKAITAVHLFLNTPPWDLNAEAIVMNSVDGSFDSPTEEFSGVIDTTDLSEGKHIVYAQAVNSEQQKGVVTAAYLIVGESANAQPTAEFSFSCENGICQFDATNSRDDGFISEYLWEFSDGTQSDKANLTKQFSIEGELTIKLSVTDDFGLQSSTTQITNFSFLPTATFSVECSFLVCSLNGSSSSDVEGEIEAYQWQISDGSTTYSGPTANHTFSQAGSYTITLTVTDDEGDTNDLARTVSVIAKPVEQPSSSSGGGSLNHWIFIIVFMLIIKSRVSEPSLH